MKFSHRPSHIGPDGPIPLTVHLDDVTEKTTALVPEDAETPAGNSLRDLTRTVAQLHDFGKLTEWFRDHLLSEGPATPGGPSHHAPLGALVTHYALSARGFEGIDPLVGFLAVAKHHGQLPDTAEYVEDATVVPVGTGRLMKLYREEAPTQVQHLDDTVADIADELLREATRGNGSWTEFREQVLTGESIEEFDWIAEHACSGRELRAAPEKLPDDLYAATLQVWSALVLADKTSAKRLTTGLDVGTSAYQSSVPTRSAIDSHIAALQAENEARDLDSRTEQMNDARERARANVRRRAEQFATSDQQVATLTLPTGMGKTLSGLDAALTVLDATGGSRLVYALPFTSIIDQVAAESRNVFNINNEKQDRLTVDHHLSETVVPLAGSAEEALDDAGEEIAVLLGESWRSGMVITTFVQLFESLAGPSNARSMKLPSLYGSVVVLDEPQALPLAWWPLVDRLVEILTEQYGASIIAMTATQPQLLTDGDGEPFELVENPDEYYERLNRLSFDLHESAETMLSGESDPIPLGYPQAANVITSRLGEDASVLSICNTIDSARELTDAIKTQSAVTSVNEVYERRLSDVPPADVSTDSPGRGSWSTVLTPEETAAAALTDRSGDEPLLISLTTRHRPCDRAHLIDVAKQLTQAGESVAFVSTQLVEAGVDVSFDEVFRDFAPMDNIVQAAGRCNRSFDRDGGRVTIWLLAPPKGRSESPARAVYGLVGESLTKITAQALSTVYNGEPLPESTVTRNAVQEYFEILDSRDVGSHSYVEYVNRAEAEKLGTLSLIDERQAADVVVARTDEEAKLRDRIRSAFREHRWDDVDELVDASRELQVSVPLYPGDDETAEKLVHLNPLVPGGQRLWLDGRPGHDDGYFDPSEGVVIPDTSAEARLL
jgi:CRISPR-associated endonuclease/helicase Cas3/CRISPR-associated endonuclease Cas3-HD